MESLTIHQKLKATGVEIVEYYSDLWVYVTPETEKIINEYQFKDSVRKFISMIDGRIMFDIPLASDTYYYSRFKNDTK